MIRNVVNMVLAAPESDSHKMSLLIWNSSPYLKGVADDFSRSNADNLWCNFDM